MIKFILQGGGSLLGKKKKIFFDEISYDLDGKKKNILIVPFARYENDWPGVFKKYSKRYGRLKIYKKFILALPEIQEFKKQIKVSDIILIAGGGEESLIKYLSDIRLEDLDNKVIVGTSAGANIFSTYYYSNNRKKVDKGLGLLPIKTVCHYTPDSISGLEELINFENKLITFAIKEGDYLKIMI